MLNKKRISLVNILGIFMLVICAIPLHASNLKKLRIMGEDTLINNKEEKVDAYTLREWRKKLQNDPEVNLLEIAAQVPLILKGIDEQKAYFENISSFIPTDPPAIPGMKFKIDSNIHFRDLTGFTKDLTISAERFAKKGDLAHCQDALMMIPEILLRPMDLVPPNEVVFFGKKTSGNEVYPLVYAPAEIGIFLLSSSINNIKNDISGIQALEDLSNDLKAVISQISSINDRQKILLEQSKVDSKEMQETHDEFVNLLKSSLISLRPKIRSTFQSMIEAKERGNIDAQTLRD